MEQFGISKLDLKRRNRMQILRQLQQQGPTSRIDLSSSLELTRAAVTIISNEMIEQGILYEKGEVNTVGQKASRGRKKILIDINQNYKFAFGIAIDNMKVYIGLSNIGGEVLEKRMMEIHSSDTRETAVRQMFVHIREMMAYNCLEKHQILGIGICLNPRAVQVLNFKEESRRPIYTVLEEAFRAEFDIPVVVDSTINGIASAELMFSRKTSPDASMLMIRFSDHIDAALYIGGEHYTGYHNKAMQLAHMVIDPNGRQCRCGKKGCALAAFSDESIYVNIVNIFSEEKTPRLFEKMNGNANLLRVADVHEYVCLGDQGIEELFEERLESFLNFLNTIIAIIDPQRIIFFGHQFENEEFMERIHTYLRKYLGEEQAGLVSPSFLKQSGLYLSGCALVVRQFFIDKGGFDR